MPEVPLFDHDPLHQAYPDGKLTVEEFFARKDLEIALHMVEQFGEGIIPGLRRVSGEPEHWQAVRDRFTQLEADIAAVGAEVDALMEKHDGK